MKSSLAVLSLVLPTLLCAQEEANTDTLKPPPSITHSSKGFTFTTADRKFELQLAGRLQFRFATPFDQDPVTNNDFSTQDQATFKVNRARLKIGGHAYQPWLKYYFEYELGQSNLLDFRIMVERYKGLSLKVGQWKTDYNRERVISSGEQQTVDRSLINRPFTLDRQQGVCVYGHLDGRGMANLNYWVSALTGTGRGARENDDLKLMYVARLQWNLLGRAVSMSGSDLGRTEKPAALIAVSGVTNTSPYTRFSQAGGGELHGFSADSIGQYQVQQTMVETAFKYKGFSWQHESHWKWIHDYMSGTNTAMLGSYFQAGYFLHGCVHALPEQLELATRYAVYQPNNNVPDLTQNEYAVDVNWFFAAGHKNKLTAEYSYITFQQDGLPFAEGGRVRLQWDISF